MPKIKLLVGLKIPDTTAITAFHTLERLGYKELKKLERELYYEFEIQGDEDNFIKDIIKVDVLVNANKHSAKAFLAEDFVHEEGVVNAIVTDIGDNSEGLLHTLKERMGFLNINKISKGILWKMHIDAKNKKEIAEKITKDLLYNEHYQEYGIF